jgi:hypothetical protein
MNLRAWTCRLGLLLGTLAPLGCDLAAQEVLPKLRELARTEAYGGRFEQLFVSPDSRRLLTTGEEGDLILWDLPKRVPLRRVEPKARYVIAVALHPTEPWAVFTASSGEALTGAVWRVDFDTGATRELWPRYARNLRFLATGTALRAEFREGHGWAVETFASPSLRGADTPLPIEAPPEASPTDPVPPIVRPILKTMTNQGPPQRTFDFSDRTEGMLGRCMIAPDGTPIAADSQGQLHVLGDKAADCVTLAGHLGPVHALAFSPDGCFLAISGLGAVRIVDRAGHEVANFRGSHVVRPGPEGADFWMLSPHRLERWNAATRATCAEPITWKEPRIRMLRSGSRTCFAEPGEKRHRSLNTLAPMAWINDQDWVVRTGPLGADPMLRIAGEWKPLGDASAVTDVLQPLAAGGALLMTLNHDPHGRGRSALRRYDSAGNLQQVALLSGASTWMALAGDGKHVFVGGGWSVLRLNLETLVQVNEVPRKPSILRMEPFGADRMIATDGLSLQLLHNQTLAALHTLALPKDLDAIDTFTVAPNLRHVAVARGSDVRILVIE